MKKRAHYTIPTSRAFYVSSNDVRLDFVTSIALVHTFLDGVSMIPSKVHDRFSY
ncbi:MAG: hypothetical protein K9J17_11075 [Flavobacteriales bacterium]|nr:hypothetical protein [Flavobacteriales bacterium]